MVEEEFLSVSDGVTASRISLKIWGRDLGE
jgi:hypothetical protein